MTIAKADTLTFVNNALKRSETDIDVQIQQVLDDLSEADLLVGSDSSQSLTSSSFYLTHPTGFRAPIAITLTSSDSVEDEPLKELPGGHFEYRRLRDNDSARGTPEWYSDFNEKFWLWRPPGASFTALIEYYKNHPQGVNSIEFGDNFKNAINAGATFYVALKFKMTSYIQIWGPLYQDAKQKRIDSMPQQPYIVE